MNCSFNQSHVLPVHGFQLLNELSKKIDLRPDLQGRRLFEMVGDFQQCKLLARNPESLAKIATDAPDFMFQFPKFGIERFLELVAVLDGFEITLHEQRCFVPYVLKEVAVETDFFANNFQEIHNPVIHSSSDPEIDVF